MITNLLIGAKSAADFLSNPIIIVSVIVLIFGVALALLSKKIAIVKEKTQDFKGTRTFKMSIIIALILIFTGLLLLIIGTAVLTGLFG